MKFGKNLKIHIAEVHQIRPDFYYIDYSLLKNMLKEQKNDAWAQDAAFLEILKRNIRKVSECFEAGVSAIILELDFITITMESSDLVDVVYQILENYRATDLLKNYATWNAVAVAKILKKRRKLTNHGSPKEYLLCLHGSSFWSGRSFRALKTRLTRVGSLLVKFGHDSLTGPKRDELCPVCREHLRDAVDLSCGHSFCWTCLVLGPIMRAADEYQVDRCPTCRTPVQETQVFRDNSLSRFCHVYYQHILRERKIWLQVELYKDTEAYEIFEFFENRSQRSVRRSEAVEDQVCGICPKKTSLEEHVVMKDTDSPILERAQRHLSNILALRRKDGSFMVTKCCNTQVHRACLTNYKVRCPLCGVLTGDGKLSQAFSIKKMTNYLHLAEAA